MTMKTYVVFGKLGQYMVDAESLVRAVQTAMLHAGGFAKDWTAHVLASYPDHLQIRLLRETESIR